MRAFLRTATVLLADLASSLVFLILFSLTHNALLAAGVGMAFGLVQIGLQLVRRKPIETMEWLSLFLVLASGTATALTDDPRFVLFKPSALYAIVGLVMLRPGWMIRYLPKIAASTVPDIATYVGYAWSALMFTSAALNAYLAISTDVATWAATMAVFGLCSKAALFVAGFAAIRIATRSRLRALPAHEREAVLIATGWHSAPAESR